MKSTTGLKLTIQDMAKRIRDLREIEGYTVSEMANKTVEKIAWNVTRKVC